MNIASASIPLEIASLRSQAFGTLFGSSTETNGAADFAGILGMKTASAESAAGRNMALKDPESAYRMMSTINSLEVSFKAQYSELDRMGEAIEQMEAAANALGDAIGAGSSSADIVGKMQEFVSRYNEWIDRFARDVAPGGVLDNVQAAEISLHELEQGVRNIFNGAADGVNGLGGLGVTIDPASRRAVLDVEKLESVVAGNKQGAVSAIDEFSANFAKSADLLNAEGNFIPKQLENRSRAIRFIADNLASLRAEFGIGDPARPTGDVAKALSAYERALGIV